MRDTVNIFTISLVSLFFMALVIYFGLSTYQVDTTQSSLTEALRSSVVANTDYASRLGRGDYFVTVGPTEADKTKKEAKWKNYPVDAKTGVVNGNPTTGFEADFMSKFEHLRNVERNNSEIDYQFYYLRGSDSKTIKVIKVIVNVNGTTYRSNIAVSQRSDDGLDSR